MKKPVLVAALVALAGGAAWLLRPAAPALEEAYVGESNVAAWSRLAQVREVVVVMNYGERVGVLERRAGHARIRTAAGAEGWLDARVLLDAALWQRAEELKARTRAQPVQATAKTRVLTNVRAAPGRTSLRIYQFDRDVRVEVFGRAVAKWTPLVVAAAPKVAPHAEDHAGGAAPVESKPTAGKEEDSAKPRHEDWLLVRGRVDGAGEISGWVLSRFLEPDFPPPLRDLAAGIHFLAWYELVRVPDVDGEKPQYLAVGVYGAEGQACDFTLLRYYTWSTQRRRYETAYVESNLCGRLPVRVTSTRTPDGEARFEFAASGKRGGEVQRRYKVRLNVVSPEREDSRRSASRTK